MTDTRTQAAIAFGVAIAGAIAQHQPDEKLAACRIIRNQPQDVAELAVLYADCLLAELERTKPECAHKYLRHSPEFPTDRPIQIGEVCIKCGEIFHDQ